MISEKDLKSLRLIPIKTVERLEEVFYLYDKEDKGSRSAGLVDIFNYGYMMGIRAERAKKKKALNQSQGHS